MVNDENLKSILVGSMIFFFNNLELILLWQRLNLAPRGVLILILLSHLGWYSAFQNVKNMYRTKSTELWEENGSVNSVKCLP